MEKFPIIKSYTNQMTVIARAFAGRAGGERPKQSPEKEGVIKRTEKSCCKVILLLCNRSMLVLALIVLPLLGLATPHRHDSLATAKAPASRYRTFNFPLMEDDQFSSFEIFPLPADSLIEKRNRAHSLRETIEQSQRYRESLDAFTIVDLPIGINRAGGLVDYTVLIDKINFSPAGAMMEVFVSFTLPQWQNRLAFGGKIPLSAEGGLVGTAKIFLLGDHYVKLQDSTILTLKGSYERGSFVEIDCNGFKGMMIDAELTFPRSLMMPENAQGETIAGTVGVGFQTYVQDWNELLVQINVPPFQLTGLPGVGFHVREAYLDWSDLTNPVGLAFPVGYESAYLQSGNNNLWRGFYMKQAEVRFPPQFKEGMDTARVTAAIENMVLDDTGFSGRMQVENLIRQGDMNGWSYTLDRFQLGVVSNQLEAFDLSGKLTVPVFEIQGEPAEMGYRASLSAEGNYLFAVSLQNRVEMSLWAASLTLDQGSSVQITEKNNRFYPSARLNGMLSLNTGTNGPKASVSGIRFEQMVITTEAPYFIPGTFGIGSDETGSKASGFPIVINNIGIQSDPAEKLVGLSLDVRVNIGDDPSREGFSGTAGLIVWGKMDAPVVNPERPADGRSGWDFEKVEITAIGISVKKPDVYEIEGLVRFFENDPLYGDGFRGTVKGSLQKVEIGNAGIGIGIDVLFGKTATYRYWFADALVTMGGGVLLAPGLAAYSFGGGFYYRMKQAGQESASAIGRTQSGISYVPDPQAMGLKAYMQFGAHPKKEPLNGDVTLTVSLLHTGGISQVRLMGKAFLMTPGLDINLDVVKASAKKVVSGAGNTVDALAPNAQVYGSLDMTFNPRDNVFLGNLNIYVNVVAGIVRGTGQNNRAGWAELYFAPDTWHVLIGTPTQPMGLRVANLFTAQSYFMMGKNLPGTMAPPPKVLEEFGLINPDEARNQGALQGGNGFAMGMNFSVDTGDLRFLMFYGRFNAGAGFDMMLMDWGNSVCAGTNDPVGINGWFAEGRAYAYMQGKIGVKVDLRFYKGDYDILTIGAAAMLEAKGPNPFWMKGSVGGYYSILGGLVKGNCNFDVTVGRKCTPAGETNLLADVSMIAGITPVKGLTDVDVFNAPQVAFNVAIGQLFEISDQANVRHTYRARLDEFSVKDGAADIVGTLKWNAGNDVVVKDSRDVLPSKKKIIVRARVLFEERINGYWQTVIYQGQPVAETAETEFTTGEAPDYIPAHNIAMSYPLLGQYNYYPQEFTQGFIQLNKGQPYLFAPGAGWQQRARLVNIATGQLRDFSFTYNEGRMRVNYTMPTDLELNTLHKMELVNIPAANIVVDANVTKINRELKQEQTTAEVTTKEVEGQVDLREEKAIHSQPFRTSRYRTFAEKMQGMQMGVSYLEGYSAGLAYLHRQTNGPEPFDVYEVGLTLIQPEIELSSNWFKSQVNPMVYQHYPLQGQMTLKNREDRLWGAPPVRAAILFQPAIPQLNTPVVDVRGRIRVHLFDTIQKDLWDLQNQAVNYYVNYPSLTTQYTRDLISATLPELSQEVHNLKLKYVIPGIESQLSFAVIPFSRL